MDNQEPKKVNLDIGDWWDAPSPQSVLSGSTVKLLNENDKILIAKGGLEGEPATYWDPE